jgi:hypothetical protein
MATTTNYGWTTPDDTALVKDGAAAIRTLGSSIDTTTKNLNPSTTLGDIEYRSSTPNVNTRLPLGTAGQVLKVNSGATAPEWATDASGMTNPMTTTGDTIYSSSGSTPARLGIGTTGQVLTVAGGVPSWATPAGGGGKVLQVVQATNSVETDVTSSSYTDSGLSGTITPTLATSKVMILVSQVAQVGAASSTSVDASFNLVRGATEILSRAAASFGMSGASGNLGNQVYLSTVYLDSPATTSATTYKTQMRVNGSKLVRSNVSNSTSVMLLLEIGA